MVADTTEIVVEDVVVGFVTNPTTREALVEEDVADTAAIALAEGVPPNWIPNQCWCDNWLPLSVGQENSRT